MLLMNAWIAPVIMRGVLLLVEVRKAPITMPTDRVTGAALLHILRVTHMQVTRLDVRIVLWLEVLLYLE